MKFRFYYRLEGVIDASTLEDAKLRLDSAVDYSNLETRNVHVKSDNVDVAEEEVPKIEA